MNHLVRVGRISKMQVLPFIDFEYISLIIFLASGDIAQLEERKDIIKGCWFDSNVQHYFCSKQRSPVGICYNSCRP